MATIRLTDSRQRRKLAFEPIDPQNVRMYVCGPTVYDRAHLGNARPVVVFDVLFRLLRHVYGEGCVAYVRNFTDVDDKINARAAAMRQAGDGRGEVEIIRTLTDETIAWYHEDMDALGALRPTFEPRATEYVGQMIAMIAELVARGCAYVAAGHVLFRVRSFDAYGALSGRSVDDMIAGARVEVAPFKEDPLDFVLWKPSEAGLPGWDSPWGRGRPGWHIECSAMSHALLGESFDIHGGGLDLQFPHHENEVAQSRCAHPHGEFARYWLHNEMLLVDGRKMSKSLGNFFTVRDLLDRGVPGEVIRLVLLSTHYRRPMDWTADRAREAEATLRKWRGALTGVSAGRAVAPVVDALADDINTAQAIAGLHALFARWQEAGTDTDRARREGEFLASAGLLGLLSPALGRWCGAGREPGCEAGGDLLEGFARRLAVLRGQAVETGDFSAVDALRATLVAAGVEVRMSKAGVDVVAGPGFDAAALKASE